MTCCHHDDVVLEWRRWCSDGVDISSLMALLIEVEISVVVAAVDVAVVAALASSTGAAAVAKVTHVE